MKISKRSNTPCTNFNISQSALGRFLDCRQKAKHALDGWVSKDPSRPLLFGTFFHNCLAVINAHIQRTGEKCTTEEIEMICNENWEAFLNSPDAASTEAANNMQYDCQVICLLLTHYVNHWFSKDKNKNWINIEGRIDARYENNNLMGYLDGAYTLNKDKEVWIFETKTKSREDLESLGRILHMEFQSFYYMHLFKLKTGRLPNGICYNIIFKPSIRKKQDESMPQFLKRLNADIVHDPSKYFTRLEVSIDPNEYTNWVRTTLKPLIVDYANWVTGKAPSYKNTAMCNGKYGKCPYLELCAMGSTMYLKKHEYGGRK